MTLEDTNTTLTIPEGETLPEAFLEQARRQPNRVIVTDQASGARTYRDLITSILALKPKLARMEGEYIGILMPAGVGAVVSCLAALFAGKIPVMINWTTGERSIRHALDSLNVKCIISVREFVSRLTKTGIDLSGLGTFFNLDEFARTISRREKLKAAFRARLSWKSLAHTGTGPTAVVLFTSGSENLPKAVPLSHKNILANMRDVVRRVNIYKTDSLLGLLPPFHAFGITTTMFLPLCIGFPVVYHPNPLEKHTLVRLIETHGIKLIVGTPTFLGGIARAAADRQFDSLRLAIIGAEKCPESVYDMLVKRGPGMIVLEGYGITECSPVVSIGDVINPKRGAIGQVLHSIEYAIIDLETGDRVRTGESGMLLLRGPSIFSGYLYYEGPSPFVKFEDMDWYRTGDIVSEDHESILTFHGRLKRFAKIGGEMVSLPAIESVLGERYKAEEEGCFLAVEAHDGETHPKLVLFTIREISRESANQTIREAGLSALHNIRHVVQLEAIPTLGTGKTDYRALKAMLD